MVSLKLISQFTFVLFCNLSFAANSEEKNCADIVLKNEAVGTTCRTNAGVRFQRFQDPDTQELGIADLARRVVWFDKITTGVTQETAFRVCANGKGRGLPYIKTFKSSEQNGFREAFSDDMRDFLLWSSSYQRHYPDEYGWYYKGATGETSVMWSYQRARFIGVRCVRDL